VSADVRRHVSGERVTECGERLGVTLLEKFTSFGCGIVVQGIDSFLTKKELVAFPIDRAVEEADAG